MDFVDRVGEIPVVNQPHYAGHSHDGCWNRLIFLQYLLAVPLDEDA